MATSRRHLRISVTLIAVTLALCSSTPAADFAGGTGDPNEPYLIASTAQLLALSGNSALGSESFKLTTDIDLAGLEFSAPLVTTFSGTFDGDGHVIRHLYLTGLANLGLFGEVQSSGVIRNLSVLEADVLSTQYAGILAAKNAGTIEHCVCSGTVAGLGSASGGLVASNTGTVTGSRSAVEVIGDGYAGGLVGNNSGTVANSAATGSVFGDNYIGALVGHNSGMVSASYANSDARGYSNVSGLVGYNTGAVTTCYATGSASGSNYVGGLIGYNSGTLRGSYSIATVTATSSYYYSVGYLVGSGSTSSVTSCYYVPLQPISGTYATTAGTALTSQQMKQQASLVGWDFWGSAEDGTTDIWFLPANAYPVLAWQADVTGLVVVPDVAGLSLDEAKVPLTAAGLVVGTVTEDYHRTLPAGNVIWTYPHAYALPGDAVNLVLSMGKTYDWAANTGNGSLANPYQIQTAGQLETLSDHADMWDKCFLVTANLDMSGRTYPGALIAPDTNSVAGFQGTTFTGSFNGGKHNVLNLQISRGSSAPGTYLGLFGMIDNVGQVSGLSLKNVTVSTGTTTSATYVGTLAGLSGGTVVDCSATGIIWTDYNCTAGGLIGYNHGSVVNCQADVPVIRAYSTPSTGGTATRGS